MTIDRHCGGNTTFEEIPQEPTTWSWDGDDRKPRDGDRGYKMIGGFYDVWLVYKYYN